MPVVPAASSRTVIFCDGATKQNPGPGGWGAVVVTPDGRVTELGGAMSHTTNNRMELTAAISALERVQSVGGPLDVYTDSTYVIKGIREWIWAWRRRGWKTVEGNDVLNRDLWEVMSALVQARGTSAIEWHYVRGHVGTPGNERCDAIADGLARHTDVRLYSGPLAAYDVDILDVPTDTAVPARSSGPRKEKVAAHSYVSVVDGRPTRHATWAECERYVKGRSGAKFKKSISAADEAAILRSWNVDPLDL
ncbi:MAG: ribonuclease HI [Acidobacteria bacterium]|nr:ribonuclease HI [Acidobacteriota bacterium]